MVNSGEEKPGGMMKGETILIIRYYCVFPDLVGPRFLTGKEWRIKLDY